MEGNKKRLADIHICINSIKMELKQRALPDEHT